MAGLLGFDFTPEQQSNLTQGLLGAVGAGLAGRGNARQNIGVGLLGGVNAYQNAQQNNLQEMYRTAMVENQQAQAAERRQKAEMAQRQQSYLGSGGSPSASQVLANGQGPTVANAQAMNRPAGYTLPGLLSVGVSPEDAQKILNQGVPQIKDIDAKDYTQESLARFLQSRNPADLVAAREMKIAQNGVVYDPYGVKPGAVYSDPNRPFTVGPDGRIVSNDPYQKYKKDVAQAGAARTNVNVTNKAAESIAGQVGPMLKDSQGEASAAIKSINAANSIDAALNTGNIFTGTGANQRLTVAQIADTIGIGGADQKAKLANTREALQGLAQLTLQGRQQMRGQGAITDSESALAQRAISGDLSLTPSEIRVLTAAARRSGEYAYGEHQKRVRTLESNPTLAPMVPFYSLPPLPQKAPAQPDDIDALMKKYGGR